MTSRTFPLSRQRRRRIVNKPPIVPTQDGLHQGGTADEQALGDELEREASPQRTQAGEPVDTATREAGARPGVPRLPHEHDEHADPPSAPRPEIAQAEADLEAGLEDTDCRATPGTRTTRGGRGHCP